jgi:hypothetical protein
MRYNLPDYPGTIATPAKGVDYEVRGKSASSYEYNFARALDYWRLDFLFQVNYWGGRRFRGGLVLDFLVFTVPQYTPVWVNGEYWHSGGRKEVDFLQQIMLNSIFRGRLRPALVLWGKDVGTFEDAKSTVRRKLL